MQSFIAFGESEVKDSVSRLWSKWGEAVTVVCFSAFVFVFLLSDRLVWMDDVGKMNVNGWIGFIHSLIPLFLLALVPLCLLGSRARYFYIPLFFTELILQAMGWFARINFKMLLDGDWVGIVLGSSSDEMLWFVKHYATVSLFVFLVAFAALLFGVWKLTSLACHRKVTSTTVAVGVGAILVFFYANRVLDTYVSGKFEKLEKQMFGVNLLVDSVRHWDDFRNLAALKTNPKIPKTIRLAENATNDVLGVIILGESATRSHWNLYGYERETTPCMKARKNELVIFEDLVTPIGSTAESMRYTFTTRTVEKKSDLRFTMAQCLKTVGYEVAMFANQGRWGEWDGDESFDFAGCDPFLFMKEQGETNVFDEVLLPYYTNYIAKAKGKTVVFLHFQGSHVPASGHYPKEGAPFKPEVFAHSADSANPELARNHYDNSIWYTDKIIERVICELEAKHRPSWLIYFSDHGETPSSKSWRTQTDNDLWEVPFIAWTSKEFNEMNPDKLKALKGAAGLALQSDQLMYGLLSFCDVEGLGNRPEEDFLNPSFKCREKRMVQNGQAVYVPRKQKASKMTGEKTN